MTEKVSEDEMASADVEASGVRAPASEDKKALADSEATGVKPEVNPAPAEDDDEDDIAIEVDASELPPAGDEDDGGSIEALEGRIAALEREKKETYDRLLRATADLENFRKRSRRDVVDARVDGKGQVIREMLPVVDNLERALQHAQETDDNAAESMLEGISLVLRQFVQSFERCDVRAFESVGEVFDPNVHEAVGQLETDDFPSGAVAKELQRGYMVGERLLRPAMVVVARPSAEPAENAPDSEPSGDIVEASDSELPIDESEEAPEKDD